MIPVPTADWTGSRSTGNGITAATASTWGATSPTPGFTISWSITDTGNTIVVGGNTYDVLNYSYTETVSKKDFSHTFLQVSDGAVNGDFTNQSPNMDNDSPKTVTTQTGNSSALPQSIYAIDYGSQNGLSVTFSFDTWREPVWGSFYAQDGKDGGNDVFAYNTGFTSTSTRPDVGTTDFTDWIPTPDSTGIVHHDVVPVPEPSTVVGATFAVLSGLAYAWRRRKSK